ncbi:MAG: hypothetical protein K0S18_151 [Anaerocolumna sp.]|jgi:hypothetical protein|nr:hypothetical protein [Anaerocolumna sp.]
MNLKEAKKAFEDNKMVQHKEDKNICNYISCFDDEETGVYLKHSHTFIPLEKLQLFNVHDYAKSLY